MSRLLLNCDIGESFGNWTMGLDAEVMPFIDCANVACGFHAGDPSIMRKTVSLAFKHGVQVGAHPAYQDLQGFGRRSMNYTPQEIQDLLHYQIGALDGICRAQGGRVSYVKPHGAMYNDMMANPAQLRAVIQARGRLRRPAADAAGHPRQPCGPSLGRRIRRDPVVRSLCRPCL